MQKIIPVILCGGSGSRLWPLSRMDVPKQFLKLLDNYSLLQRTALRALNVSGASETDMVIVTLGAMRDETAAQLSEVSPFLTRHILCEPQARNTAAAVAYALQHVEKTFGPDALAWILPSDHYVGNEDALAIALEKAAAAADEGYLVTFGIKPTRPETGYGYILKDSEIGDSGVCRVGSFIEKPRLDVAAGFVQSGRYLWSSGMHVFRVETAINHFARHAPAIWETVAASLKNGGAPVADIYAMAEEAPFEIAVMEKADRIAVVPCDPQWSDIGCWESLWEIKPKNENGNAFRGRVVCEKTADSMIFAQNRLVTCVGLKNVIIIETEDSVLVADKQDSAALKELVKALQRNGHKEVMAPIRRHAVQEVVQHPVLHVPQLGQHPAYGTA